MVNPLPSWLRETLKLFIQYLGVGVASIPAGLIYILMVGIGVNQSAALITSLCIGFVLAYFTWKFLDNLILFPRALEKATYRRSTTDTGINVQIQYASVSFASGLHFEGVIEYGTPKSTVTIVIPANTPLLTASNTTLQTVV